MANGNFDAVSFDGSIGGFDVDASPIVPTDKHDGGDDIKRVHDVPGFDEPTRERDAKDRLRDMLARSVDPASYAVPEEAIAAAAPVFERLESGAIKIDWERIERENVLRAQLYAYAAEYERKRIEFEEDEDDVSLLLWH